MDSLIPRCSNKSTSSKSGAELSIRYYCFALCRLHEEKQPLQYHPHFITSCHTIPFPSLITSTGIGKRSTTTPTTMHASSPAFCIHRAQLLKELLHTWILNAYSHFCFLSFAIGAKPMNRVVCCAGSRSTRWFLHSGVSLVD